MPTREGTTYGFKRSGALLASQIRKGSESRGFAVSRVVTHWPEIAGEEVAAFSRPVKVSYTRGGFGATLTVLTTGAQAPILEMQKEALRDRVNAAYGYNAISRIHITQTAPVGFSEGQADFEHRPRGEKATPEPDTQTQAEAADLADPVADNDLRAALEKLGQNVLTKSKISKP
ncbi:DUF721 domain-containing protein [Roseovarius phycicola]|uniref:DUF721 domain-containing protein n=1 Tax=Roseovarius phycicola TaxID=3080976 RepID=A0ABZ2HGI8_9RHOB